MKFAYADPPYLGCGSMYKEHPEHAVWDDPETHRHLINRLVADFPDGWALSLTSSSLRVILPMCPTGSRVCAWVKTFAFFKGGVNPPYAWEPVIVCGGRPAKERKERPYLVRDWVACNAHGVTPQERKSRTTLGSKPDPFCWWVFDLLGMEPDDEFHDLFPGSGAVTRAWETYRTNLFQRERSA